MQILQILQLVLQSWLNMAEPVLSVFQFRLRPRQILKIVSLSGLRLWEPFAQPCQGAECQREQLHRSEQLPSFWPCGFCGFSAEVIPLIRYRSVQYYRCSVRSFGISERSFAMAIGIASKRMHIMQMHIMHIMHMHCITQRDPAAPKCTDSVLLCGCACLWFCNRSPEITGTCNELQRVATSCNELQRVQQLEVGRKQRTIDNKGITKG